MIHNLKFCISSQKFCFALFNYRISVKNCPLTVFISVIFAVFEVRFANLINLLFCKYFILLGDDQIFITTKLCKNIYLELYSSHVTAVLLTSILPLKLLQKKYRIVQHHARVTLLTSIVIKNIHS